MNLIECNHYNTVIAWPDKETCMDCLADLSFTPTEEIAKYKGYECPCTLLPKHNHEPMEREFKFFNQKGGKDYEYLRS